MKGNQKKHCQSFSDINNNQNDDDDNDNDDKDECIIALKFRDSVKRDEVFGSCSSLNKVHSWQNVFKKFGVPISNKQSSVNDDDDNNRSKKKRNRSDEDDSSNKSTTNKKPKGSLKDLVNANEDKLPFTWNQLLSAMTQMQQQQ